MSSEIHNSNDELKSQNNHESRSFDPDKKIDVAENKNTAAESKYDPDKRLERLEKYYDDNGKEYRIGDNLKPNTRYDVNGYKYKTDAEGRIISVSGKLSLKPEGQKKQDIKDSMDVIGKGDQLETDDRGHLVGDQLNGSNGLENMVAQDSSVNKGDYKVLENKLAAEVKAGNNVEIKIQPIYSENSASHRPEAISYTYSINGKKSVVIFSNSKDGAK